jgi:hypothetical protein
MDMTKTKVDEQMTSQVETVTLGAQTSREDDRTMRHVLRLRRLLAKHCQGPYSSEIKEFALVLRIGGEMQEFDFEGCERIRRSRREKYITVDIGFPSYRWKGISDEAILGYLAEAVETGLLCCLRRLEKDKTPVDGQKLINDFQQARSQLLKSVSE